MKRKKYLKKLAGMISDLDEIIASKGGETHCDGKVLKCRKRLQKLYNKCLKADEAEDMKVGWKTVVAAALIMTAKALCWWMKNQ